MSYSFARKLHMPMPTSGKTSGKACGVGGIVDNPDSASSDKKLGTSIMLLGLGAMVYAGFVKMSLIAVGGGIAAVAVGFYIAAVKPSLEEET